MVETSTNNTMDSTDELASIEPSAVSIMTLEQTRKRDALDLANLIYDMYKERCTSVKIESESKETLCPEKS